MVNSRFCILVQGDEHHLDDTLTNTHLKMSTGVSAMTGRPSWSSGLVFHDGRHWNDGLGALTG